MYAWTTFIAVTKITSTGFDQILEAAMLNKLSLFSKHAHAAVVEGPRTALPANVARSLSLQFTYLSPEQLASFTCERHRSQRADAREDIAIYDSEGTLRYSGRSFDGRTMSFWKPS
jgi:hypothetical protein